MAGFSACSFLLVLSIFFEIAMFSSAEGSTSGCSCWCVFPPRFFFLVVSMTSSIFSLNVDLLASSVLFPFCFGCLSFSFFSCYVFLNFYIVFSWRMYILFFVFYCVWGPSDNIGAGSPRSDAGGEFSFIFVSLRSLFSEKKFRRCVFYYFFHFVKVFIIFFSVLSCRRRRHDATAAFSTGATRGRHRRCIALYLFVWLTNRSFASFRRFSGFDVVSVVVFSFVCYVSLSSRLATCAAAQQIAPRSGCSSWCFFSLLSIWLFSLFSSLLP